MSKAALNAAGVSLAHDLKGDGMSVAILHPGMPRIRHFVSVHAWYPRAIGVVLTSLRPCTLNVRSTRFPTAEQPLFDVAHQAPLPQRALFVLSSLFSPDLGQEETQFINRIWFKSPTDVQQPTSRSVESLVPT